MLISEVAQGENGRIVIMDSIARVTSSDAGAIVVSASHGGTSSGEFALAVPLKAVFFNDAGVGKDNAGIAALDMLQEKDTAAGTVAHTSARIGDSADAWENGVISNVNTCASELGLVAGVSLRIALTELIS